MPWKFSTHLTPAHRILMQSFIFLITKTVSRTCNSRNGHFLISYLPWLIAYQFIDTLFQQLQRTDTYQAFISCILSLHIHTLFRKCCFNTSVAWSSAMIVKYSVAILRNAVPVKLSFNRNQASLILPLMFTACFMSCGICISMPFEQLACTAWHFHLHVMQ